MSLPDAATRLCAVLGHPVSHSLSPAIHNAALRHDGVNGVYLAFDAKDLEPAVSGLRVLGAVGANVTVPHKRAAAGIAGVRSADVELTGAANVLVFGPRGIEAHNTDLVGFDRALREVAGDPAGRRCLLLGAGGAGRAAAWSLARSGASVLVANRTHERAAELAAALGGDARAVAWPDLDAAAGGVDILVNATSVGLEEGSPLADHTLRLASLGGCAALLDLVYGPNETELVRRARASGIPAADGLSMLVHQAAAAYELFWNRPAPVTVMTQAARRATTSVA